MMDEQDKKLLVRMVELMEAREARAAKVDALLDQFLALAPMVLAKALESLGVGVSGTCEDCEQVKEDETH